MKFIKKVTNKVLKKDQPKYGWGIFQQRTWLNKQVDDAMYKRTIYNSFGIN